MAVKEKIRIRIKGYDHQLVDQSAEKIVATAKRTGARVSGPVPLPTERQIITILRAQRCGCFLSCHTFYLFFEGAKVLKIRQVSKYPASS